MGFNALHWPRLGWVLLFFILLLPEVALFGFFTAGAVLSSPAASPHHADVVVVLGGGDGSRYARGRELVQANYGARMVMFEPSMAERQDVMAHLRFVEFWDDVHPQNSWGEAQAVRIWMQANGFHTALVVSDPPHLLRVNYAWFSNFRGTDLSYTLISSKPPWWSAWHWWANPQSTRFVESEVLKLGYYVVRYRFGF